MAQPLLNSNSTQDVDDLYLALLGELNRSSISDEEYSAELQLQEVIQSSLLNLPSQDHGYVLLKNIVTPSKPDVLSSRPEASEAGESSASFCEICMEPKPQGDMFTKNNCSHAFCCDCTGKHIAARLQQLATVRCPSFNCEAILEPENCKHIIPGEVFERWERAIVEYSAVLTEHIYYCPFQNCSALLANDGGEVVTSSECPTCHRLFCAQCRVPWHAGVTCEEFQSLAEDDRGGKDLMLIELAKKSRWKRCPRCKFFVEKTEGCVHITCRCAFQFCYVCGGAWENVHTSCTPP